MALIKLEQGRKGEQPRYVVRLHPFEALILGSLPARLRELLLDPARSPRVVDRLFPPGHRNDPGQEAVHRELLGRSLFEERLAALQDFEKTLVRHGDPRRDSAIRLLPAEMRLWLHVVNDFRLLLGTELDIHENEWSARGPERPEDARSFELLLRLTALQQELLEALEG